MSKTHNLSIGTLVELDTGVRLFIVAKTRDCDGTPLYELSPDKDDTEVVREGFKNRKWFGGFQEDSLKVVRVKRGK